MDYESIYGTLRTVEVGEAQVAQWVGAFSRARDEYVRGQRSGFEAFYQGLVLRLLASRDDFCEFRSLSALPSILQVGLQPLEGFRGTRAAQLYQLQGGRFFYVSDWQVGRGSYGAVYLGFDLQERRKVAVKETVVQALGSNYSKRLQQAQREIDIQRGFQHANIVRVLHYDQERRGADTLFRLVMEYCPVTLEQLVRDRGRMSADDALRVVRGVACGYRELYMHNVIHRDLKPNNILFAPHAEPLVPKIADFGLSRALEGCLAETYAGAPLYMAPEILRREQYGPKCDVWSLGVVLFYMLTLRFPYPANSLPELLMMMDARNPLADPELPPPDVPVVRLLRRLLVVEPNRRITWEEVFAELNLRRDPLADTLAESDADRLAESDADAPQLLAALAASETRVRELRFELSDVRRALTRAEEAERLLEQQLVLQSAQAYEHEEQSRLRLSSEWRTRLNAATDELNERLLTAASESARLRDLADAATSRAEHAEADLELITREMEQAVHAAARYRAEAEGLRPRLADLAAAVQRADSLQQDLKHAESIVAAQLREIDVLRQQLSDSDHSLAIYMARVDGPPQE